MGISASQTLKPLYWVTTSRADMRKLPADVQDVFGFALYQAQVGRKPLIAKVLHGFGSAGVLELLEDHQGSPPIEPCIRFDLSGPFTYCTVFKRNPSQASLHPSQIWTRLKNASTLPKGTQRETNHE